MTEVVRKPTRVGSGIAVAAAGFSLTALVPAGALGAAPGVAGLALVVAGVVRGDRRALDAGAALLFLGAIVAATTSVTAVFPLVAAALAVVAWDVGENATSLGEQLGRTARTSHAELTHAVATSAVGLLTAGGAFLVYRLARGGRPLPALVLLLLAVLVLTTVLRR